VADRKRELEVWDLKYAETCNPSIVSGSFIQILQIYVKFWSSTNEKKA